MPEIGVQYVTPKKHLEKIAELKKEYVIGKVIGSGRYGFVCNATMGKGDKKTEIAVKIIDLSKSSDEYKNKFLPKELTALRELKHNYIVKVFDIKDVENTYYIFMERAFGGDIIDMLEDKKFNEGIPEPKVKTLYKMIGSAIKYMHDKGTAHRDIKSENILLMNKERNIAKLTDFGFSTHCYNPKTQTKTLRATFCGTPCYSAPEIDRHKPYDAMKADVWSLGVVLYIMLQNEMPFSQIEMKQMAKEPKPVKLSITRKNISKESIDLITKQLDIDPDKRLTMSKVMAHKWLQ